MCPTLKACDTVARLLRSYIQRGEIFPRRLDALKLAGACYVFAFHSFAESAPEKLCKLVFVDITLVVGNDIGHPRKYSAHQIGHIHVGVVANAV